MADGVTGVVGTDGKVPIYNPEGRWCWWALAEIFTGGIGNNKYIPKVNDYVMDYTTFTVYIVDALDHITLIPTLREIKPNSATDGGLSEIDQLLGATARGAYECARVYIDKSVTPFIMAVDTSVKVPGTMSSYAKIFRGSDVSGTGEVISKTYDSNGVFVSENIPLELVQTNNITNYSEKIVDVCNTLADLPTNELVTLVIYSDNGHVVYKRALLTENTDFIRSVNTSQKYVTHISLVTPYLSPTVDDTINFPLNTPIEALNLMARAHYSDGSYLELPVDGTKFRMFGLDQFVSTIISQKVDLVLSYSLAPNEVAIGPTNEPYKLVVTNPNNSIAVKLFGYPFWIDDANGYQMRWWLFNLDRNIFFEVTQHVNFDLTTGPFNPKGYGYLQQKSVSINLRDVSSTFKAFVHFQKVEIVLNGPPDPDRHTPWTMSQEQNSARPSYGVNLLGLVKSSSSINLAANCVDLPDWLLKVYGYTYPLVNQATGVAAPTPTHFVVTYNGVSTEYAVSNWSSDLNVANNVVAKSTVSIRFIKRTSSGDMQLAMAAMVLV